MVGRSHRWMDATLLGKWYTTDDGREIAITVDQPWDDSAYRLRWKDEAGRRQVAMMSVGRLDTLLLAEVGPVGGEGDFRAVSGEFTGPLLPLYMAAAYRLRGDTLEVSFPKDGDWEPYLSAHGLGVISVHEFGWVTAAPTDSLRAGLLWLAEHPDSGWVGITLWRSP